ncbi:hypothetical protein RJ639_043971 [Escallonia herrerae]|uniref:G-patch domain-containing protein n=1 Tax=Escallonia herrerae TaxID=1293975 RepID=A0AA89B2X4_9ASTE|nr:hypothetical protein RJ639_043971 [Escallonia herrerae]
MKLSFSLNAKPSKHHSNIKPSTTTTSTTEDNHLPDREYLTHFYPSKTPTDSRLKRPVIPPQPNHYRPHHKKLKNLHQIPLEPESDPNTTTPQFEPDITKSEPHPSDSAISYGLNLRQQSSKDAAADATTYQTADALMLQRLKTDLKELPEDRGFEEFEDMPVEGYGEALLAGYGWCEGKGIGLNTKEDVKVVEYKPRAGREGLGFVGDRVPRARSGGSNSKRVNGEKREPKNEGFYVGKDVRVMRGREMGLKGRIVDVVDGGNSVVLKLSRDGEGVTKQIRDVADLEMYVEMKELKIKEGVKGKDSSRDRSNRESMVEVSRSKSQRKLKDREKEGEVAWLTSQIRVRIISKELKGGRLYLKKAVVVDVVGPTTCDVSMDESREVITVDQESLETALPRRGGLVLILYGRHKGVYGSLMERDVEKETGVVRDADTHELLNVRLEQIAEYTGDPADNGY